MDVNTLYNSLHCQGGMALVYHVIDSFTMFHWIKLEVRLTKFNCTE